MFQTLELQYLNKLSKGEVRDFASPKTFHTVKVECLGHDGIKPSAKVRCTFVVPIFALIRNLPIETGEFADSTPPVVRTFDLTRKAFMEFTELIQGVFQGLRMFDFFTRVQCQIRLQPEIYSYALTCSRIGFGRGIIRDNVKPKCSNGNLPKDLDIANSPFPFTVLVKRKPTLLKLKGLRGFVPRFERESDTPFFYEVRRLKLRRTVAVFALEFRQSAKSVKKAIVCDMDTSNYLVKRIARYPSPVLVCTLKQIRQVRLKAEASGVLAIDTVISLFQFEEVVVDIAKIVKHVAQAHIFRMFAYLIFIRSARAFLFSLSLFGFHWISRITLFNPCEVGRQTHNQAVVLHMSANVIYILDHNSLRLSSVFSKKMLWSNAQGADFPPLHECRGLQSED